MPVQTQGYNYPRFSHVVSPKIGISREICSPIVPPKLPLVYSCSPLCCSNARGCGITCGNISSLQGFPRPSKQHAPHPIYPFTILQQMATTFGPPLPVELPCLHRLMAYRPSRFEAASAVSWLDRDRKLGLPIATATTFTFHDK